MYYGTGQEKATIEFITLRHYHTEMNYLFFDLLEKLKNMINSKAKKEQDNKKKSSSNLKQQNLENSIKIASDSYSDPQYFFDELCKEIEGTYFIYVYASPCLHCLQRYYKIMKKFPNLKIKVYYSVEFLNDYSIFKKKKITTGWKKFFFLNPATRVQSFLLILLVA